MHQKMTLLRPVWRAPKFRQLTPEFQEPLDIALRGGEPAGRRLDDVVEMQGEPPVRREPGEGRRVGPLRVEDRQHVGDPGGAMLAEFRNAADGHLESREAGSHAAGFTTFCMDHHDNAAAIAGATPAVTAGSSL
jgi:hypothetical protein